MNQRTGKERVACLRCSGRGDEHDLLAKLRPSDSSTRDARLRDYRRRYKRDVGVLTVNEAVPDPGVLPPKAGPGSGRTPAVSPEALYRRWCGRQGGRRPNIGRLDRAIEAVNFMADAGAFDGDRYWWPFEYEVPFRMARGAALRHKADAGSAAARRARPFRWGLPGGSSSAGGFPARPALLPSGWRGFGAFDWYARAGRRGRRCCSASPGRPR